METVNELLDNLAREGVKPLIVPQAKQVLALHASV